MILEAIMTWADRAPHKTALTLVESGATRSLTYGNLADGISGCAQFLKTQEISAGDVVALILPPSEAQYLTFLGVMAAGAIPSFFPPLSAKQDEAYYWASHKELFQRTGIKRIIATSDNLDALERYLGAEDFSFTIVSPQSPFDDRIGKAQHAPRPEDIAFLQHSSGTTGLKKGVMLTHGAVIRQIADYTARLSFSESDVVASWLPLYHDMGLITSFIMPLVCGASIVSVSPFEWVTHPTILLDIIEQYEATFAWMPNFAFQHIVRSARSDRSWNLSSIKALISCSEPCKPVTVENFLYRFAQELRPGTVQACYAMAETVFAVSQTALDESPRKLRADRDIFASEGRLVAATPGREEMAFLSCGLPLPQCSVEIVDETGAKLGENAVGQITIAGSYTFEGYFRRPELTSERIKGGRYLTGDLGFTNDGELFVIGRNDDLIISYGRNFFAHEIEACVSDIENVVPGRVVALGVPNDEMGTQDAIVIAEVADGSGHQEIRATIKKRVSQYVGVVPAKVLLVERGWLQKTSSGKISRTLNLSKYLASLKPGSTA